MAQHLRARVGKTRAINRHLRRGNCRAHRVCPPHAMLKLGLLVVQNVRGQASGWNQEPRYNNNHGFAPCALGFTHTNPQTIPEANCAHSITHRERVPRRNTKNCKQHASVTKAAMHGARQSLVPLPRLARYSQQIQPLAHHRGVVIETKQITRGTNHRVIASCK